MSTSKNNKKIEKYSTLGKVSFIFGIISIFIYAILIPPVIALILGINSLIIDNTEKKWPQIWGVTLGSIYLVAWAIGVITNTL